MLTAEERALLVDGWDGSDADYGTSGRCLHELVAERAHLSPDAAAVRFLGAELSYGELNGRANRIAHHLRGLGFSAEAVVGVLVERDLHLPAAVLGVLKAGAAYLPLDPDHPKERLSYLVADAGCDFVVTTTDLATRLPDDVVRLCLDDEMIATMLDRLPAGNPAAAVGPDNLAYVIYTSGSTGRPKGTLVPHRGLVNLVSYAHHEYGVGPADRVLQYSNLCFDVSAADIFGALTSGATLVLVPRLTLVDPRALTELMRSERVTVAAFTPAVLALLDPADLPDLRLLHVGGEALTREQADHWSGPRRTVYHQYGPTEVTVCCADHRCTPGAGAAPPIGRALGNLRAYIVDAGGDLVAPGVTGELVMAGVGVSRGYLNRPGLTAEKFVPNPFGPPGTRLYRTGDLMRWRSDGTLEFGGRVDTQIKLHGHRIEPGECESALRELDAVRMAVVDVTADGDGDPGLVAYLVLEAGDGELTLAQVRAHLRDRLPSYLIPRKVVTLDSLPLTGNGKVDRRELRRLQRP